MVFSSFRWRWLVIAVVAGAFGTGSFALARLVDTDRGCTLIGSYNGVMVGIPTPEPGLSRAVACIDESCNRLPLSETFRSGFVSIPERDAGPREVSVVLVLERGARRAKIRTTAVRLRRFEPNGAGCGTYWNARVVFDGEVLRPR